jgi:hypothetical protein
MGRVKILLVIGMLMMMAVMSRPPKRSSLGRAGPENGKYELGRAAGFECLVGEVTVVKSGNREHAHQEEGDRKPHGECAGAGVNGQKAGQMECYERNNSQEIERSGGGVNVIRTCFGIEPPQNICKQMLHSGHTLIALSLLMES